MWYQKLDTYIIGLGFVRNKANSCVYTKQVGEHYINIVLYVDDMLLIENNMNAIKEVKWQLSSKFDMKDLNATSFIVDMVIKRNSANMKLWLNQRKYVEMILQIFIMWETKPAKTQGPHSCRCKSICKSMFQDT